jgi:mRNA interferase RelE/StbE
LGYQIRIAPAAARDIGKLPAKIQESVLDRLTQLGDDLRPSGSRKIRGIPPRYEVYRIVVESAYRVIYQVQDQVTLVLVVKVADRKEVYQRLSGLKHLLR